AADPHDRLQSDRARDELEVDVRRDFRMCQVVVLEPDVPDGEWQHDACHEQRLVGVAPIEGAARTTSPGVVAGSRHVLPPSGGRCGRGHCRGPFENVVPSPSPAMVREPPGTVGRYGQLVSAPHTLAPISMPFATWALPLPPLFALRTLFEYPSSAARLRPSKPLSTIA